MSDIVNIPFLGRRGRLEVISVIGDEDTTDVISQIDQEEPPEPDVVVDAGGEIDNAHHDVSPEKLSIPSGVVRVKRIHKKEAPPKVDEAPPEIEIIQPRRRG